jgi:hypothetical protein
MMNYPPNEVLPLIEIKMCPWGEAIEQIFTYRKSYRFMLIATLHLLMRYGFQPYLIIFLHK